MNSVVETLKAKLLAEFTVEAERLSSNFSHLVTVASSGSFGLGEYEGYSIWIDCVFTDAPLDEPDSVSLCVSLHRLTTQPKINADVCWSSGDIEAELWPGWKTDADFPEISEETLEILYTGLPRLVDALNQAVERRRPHNKCS